MKIGKMWKTQDDAALVAEVIGGSNGKVMFDDSPALLRALRGGLPASVSIKAFLEGKAADGSLEKFCLAQGLVRVSEQQKREILAIDAAMDERERAPREETPREETPEELGKRLGAPFAKIAAQYDPSMSSAQEAAFLCVIGLLVVAGVFALIIPILLNL